MSSKIASMVASTTSLFKNAKMSVSLSDVGFGNGRPKGRVGASAGDARGRPGLT